MIKIFEYDEASNLALLTGLPPRLRVVFALLAAVRILPAYRRFHARTGRGDPTALEDMTDRLWRDVSGEPMTKDEVQAVVVRAMGLIPSEDDGWDDQSQAYAEDAAAAVAYACRAHGTDDPREAAWAARRVYEAADHYVLATSGLSLGGPKNEQAVLSHPVVQAELARQRRDLGDLAEFAKSGANDSQLFKLRQRSEQEAYAFFGSA